MTMVDKPSALALLQQARLMRQQGQAGAEQAYRDAIARDPSAAPPVVELAALLRQQGRLTDALAVSEPLAARTPANHGLLVAHAETLKAMGLEDQALPLYRRAARENPTSGVAAHNLAGLLGDMGQCEEAEQEARRALKSGLDAHQTWLVLARALMGLGRVEESEAAYRQVLARNAADPDTHRELAQLIWMSTADAPLSLAALDQAIAAHGEPAGLLEVKSIAAKFMGDLELARSTIERGIARHPTDAASLVTGSHLAILTGDADRGLAYAQRAVAAAPANRWPKLALCEALLAAGQPDKAATLARGLRAQEPLAQDVIAYLSTALRCLGDPEYQTLYDYPSLVLASQIDTPRGWASLPAFLADLKGELEALHVFRTHPFQQSLRQGSQVMGLDQSANPVIRALFDALAGPIRRATEALGVGAGPVRSRNTLTTRFQGAWSVRLSGGGGRHLSHIHPKGWLSSACYIDLPAEVAESTTGEGWLSFGEPGIATTPSLQAEWSVKPEPGVLVLFPSYMWHGVSPYTGAGHRLSVAFDLLPTRA